MYQLFRGALKKAEGIEQATVEALLSLAVGKLQIEHTAMAFHHRQAVKLAVGVVIGEGAEVAPVNLALLTRGGFKTDEGPFLFDTAAKFLHVVS